MRQEIKFVVPVDRGAEFMARCRDHCEFDKHTDDRGGYQVLSIYYDSPRHRFYWDREESVGFRRKVRFRAYQCSGQVTALVLEIKERHKNLVNKKRIVIPATGLPLGGTELSNVLGLFPDSEAKREVTFLYERLALRPAVAINYYRTTLVGRYDPNLRITLDSHLVSGDPGSFNSDCVPFIRPDLSILEVKASTSIPAWLHHSMLEYGFSRVRYSKYCDGLRTYWSHGSGGAVERVEAVPQEDQIDEVAQAVG